MCTKSYFSHFCEVKINLSSIEKTILNAQKKIYHASKLFEKDRLDREHKTVLLNHDVFVLITKNSIKNIKKKLIKVPTLRNFAWCHTLHYLAIMFQIFVAYQ